MQVVLRLLGSWRNRKIKAGFVLVSLESSVVLWRRKRMELSADRTYSGAQKSWLQHSPCPWQVCPILTLWKFSILAFHMKKTKKEKANTPGNSSEEWKGRSNCLFL
jgi:hypothetical protein